MRSLKLFLIIFFSFVIAACAGGNLVANSSVQSGVRNVSGAAVGSSTIKLLSLNDTGITTNQCFQAGSDDLVACDSAAAMLLSNGQDGMIGRDVHASTNDDKDGKLGFSYTSFAGGCVQDNISGLMWEVKTTDGGLRDWTKTYTNFDNATELQKWGGTAEEAITQAEIDAPTNSVGFKNAVNTQGLCGYSDWRLPTAEELSSVVYYGGVTPAVDGDWFPNTKSDLFWSASALVGHPVRAWFVSFNHGIVNGYGLRQYTNHVRLVRAGKSPVIPRYTVSDDGHEVTDNQTGLIWRRCVEGMLYSNGTCSGTASGMTHEAALRHAATHTSNTGFAWRLPNVKEFSSINDKTRRDPAIDSEVFPNTPPDDYWSSSPYIGLQQFAWDVDFGEGYVDGGLRNYGGDYVRLVRTGQ